MCAIGSARTYTTEELERRKEFAGLSLRQRWRQSEVGDLMRAAKIISACQSSRERASARIGASPGLS